MKTAVCASVCSAIALALSSCGLPGKSGGSSQLANTGPFDRNGNYVEEWADNPAKWRRSGGSPSPHEIGSDQLPEIALNDQPPQNSVPLATGSAASTKRSVPQTSAKPAPVVVQAKATAKPKPKPAPVKAKPSSTRYVIKKGDSLSSIASRNGTSVSAIQRANGIKGTLIHPGKVLSIPRR
jgi:LysM repeat protein